MSRNLSSSLLRAQVGLVRTLSLMCMSAGLSLWRSGLLRAAVALVFAFTPPASTNNSRAEYENEISAQVAEEHESQRRHGLNAETPRRLRAGPGPAARELESLEIPLSLAPRRAAAPQQRWQHPRRSIPPDEDDETLA